MPDTTIVSAPGKVLLTGGYLVLDPAYSGLVIATSSRFYSIVRTQPSAAADTKSAPKIVVKALQFNDAVWTYSAEQRQDASIMVQPIEFTNGRNKFVEIALQKTISLVQTMKVETGSPDIFEGISQLDIVIVGDNDFYSQRRTLESLSLPTTFSSLEQLKPFAHQHTTLGDVHKTGLGSSAALITSLVTALMHHFQLSPSLDLVHNMAQYVHCLAQGKVGSGFDICSAVKGSQIYTRFDERVLRALMSKDEVTGQEILETVKPSSEWTTRTAPIALPPNIRLVLADVDAGSDTPSLVGKVLKWRKENPETAEASWTALDRYNRNVEEHLRTLTRLSEQDSEAYKVALRAASARRLMGGKAASEEVSRTMQQLSESLQHVRKAMKDMGEASGVPIEPDEQTRLLDACLEIPGVIGGGVPGAGGYDAIYLLIAEPEQSTHGTTSETDTVAQVERLWQDWKELSVCPLASRADAGGLKVIEHPEESRGLKEVVARIGRVDCMCT
ncbi:phosphomevalonate kinase [Naganishia albida]|nr:phosphomevalonate kinase [Naganishia albida]